MSAQSEGRVLEFRPSAVGRGDLGRGLGGYSPHPARADAGENRWLNVRLIAQLAVVLLAAGAVKQYYSSASVNQLRWILAPTTVLVEFVTGSKFEFESYAGYVSADHTFVIAASCAGVNFLLTAFLMLTLGQLWRARSRNSAKLRWTFIPAAGLFAYSATLIANTVRISTAVRLHGRSLELGGLNANQLHRLEGIVIYFGFLLLLFVISERIANREHGDLGCRSGLFRQSLFPLLIYYVTTLGVPLMNSAGSGSIAAGFWEHSLFVILAPLILIVGLVTITRVRKFSISVWQLYP